MIKRFTKAILILIRDFAYRYDYNEIYYWAGLRVFKLRSISIFSNKLYRITYRMSMKMVENKVCLRTADWLLHRIPFNVRYELS
jgi:hypothetical protein